MLSSSHVGSPSLFRRLGARGGRGAGRVWPRGDSPDRDGATCGHHDRDRLLRARGRRPSDRRSQTRRNRHQDQRPRQSRALAPVRGSGEPCVRFGERHNRAPAAVALRQQLDLGSRTRVHHRHRRRVVAPRQGTADACGRQPVAREPLRARSCVGRDRAARRYEVRPHDRSRQSGAGGRRDSGASAPGRERSGRRVQDPEQPRITRRASLQPGRRRRPDRRAVLLHRHAGAATRQSGDARTGHVRAHAATFHQGRSRRRGGARALLPHSA